MKLINFYDGADGLKTGHTDNAGYCLSATAKRNNLRLIGIVLGEENSKVRNSEMINLLDYGFNNTKMNILKKKGSTVQKIKLDKADSKYLDVVTMDDLGVVEEIGDKNKYKYNVSLDDVSFPIYKGQVIGKIDATYKGKVVSSTKLVSNSDVKKINIFKLIGENIISFVNGF